LELKVLGKNLLEKPLKEVCLMCINKLEWRTISIDWNTDRLMEPGQIYCWYRTVYCFLLVLFSLSWPYNDIFI